MAAYDDDDQLNTNSNDISQLGLRRMKHPGELMDGTARVIWLVNAVKASHGVNNSSAQYLIG